MKTFKNSLGIVVLLMVTPHVIAQGFANLNFEFANIPNGTSTGSLIPIADALPHWFAYYNSATFGLEPTTQMAYDGISTGGPVISILDENNPGAPYFDPLQGSYSALLFGGVGFSSSISQTGTITAGTQSLLMDAWSYDASPIVVINGGPINMIPLQTFANYTLFGGTVPAADVGPSVTLSFTEPSPATGGPSEFELDNISFSQTAVPEPSIAALAAMGGLLFGGRKWFARR